jgi:hypothetical protein
VHRLLLLLYRRPAVTDVALSRKRFGGPQYYCVCQSMRPDANLHTVHSLHRLRPSLPLEGLLASFTFQIANVQHKYFIGSIEYVRRIPICLIYPQMYVDSVSEN